MLPSPAVNTLSQRHEKGVEVCPATPDIPRGTARTYERELAWYELPETKSLDFLVTFHLTIECMGVVWTI
jgi:hypothetical protein